MATIQEMGIIARLTEEHAAGPFPAYIDNNFTAIWFNVVGTSMFDLLGKQKPITLSIDPGQAYIPADYTGTITVPDSDLLKAADINNILFTTFGVQNNLSVTDFTNVDLPRIPTKYDSKAPHHLRMIGLLDPTTYPTLTDTEKESISDYLTLWIYYWDVLLGGNIKDNRSIL